MRFYLRWINPVIALLILAICCWIYFGGYFISLNNSETPFAKEIQIFDVDELGFQMYFFTKGLFCSSMLFLFGEFLKKYLGYKTK